MIKLCSAHNGDMSKARANYSLARAFRGGAGRYVVNYARGYYARGYYARGYYARGRYARGRYANTSTKPSGLLPALRRVLPWLVAV